MTELDKALELLRLDFNDATSQSKYYDLFLNSTFFIPTLDEQKHAEQAEKLGEGDVLPLVIEAEGKDYLMLFDTLERLYAWAGKEVPSVEVPGHVLAAMTEPPLHWALNAATPYSKEFKPDEIAWLRDVVERCQAEAAEKG